MEKKILVVFYSRNGHTKKVADDIAFAFRADKEEVLDKKNRQGILGWLSGGKDAMRKNTTEIAPLEKNPENYDLVIIGSPVWAGAITPAIRTYLEINKTKIRNYAFFITSGGDDWEKVSKSVEVIGNGPVAHLDLSAKELADNNIYNKKLADYFEMIRSSFQS